MPCLMHALTDDDNTCHQNCLVMSKQLDLLAVESKMATTRAVLGKARPLRIHTAEARQPIFWHGGSAISRDE